MSEGLVSPGRSISKSRSSRFSSAILITSALVLLALAATMPLSGDRPSIPKPSWLWVFVLLPGLIGVTNYLVTSRQRDAEPLNDPGAQPLGQVDAKVPAAAEPALSEPRAAAVAESEHRPKLAEALAAAIALTAIFTIVANASAIVPGANAGAPKPEFFDGLKFAGYGAYISTLWYMLVRLNVNALSPRFMLNSALKASIAMMIGFTASLSTIFSMTPAIYFLIGLSHSWAIKALRKRAMMTFGVVETSAADLSVRLLEGVDDGAVDVLEELGITSVQHLATMHAPEVCGRSLYPRERVLDWIDQSILIMHTSGRINDLRSLGIRSAYALVTVAHYSVAPCDSKWAISLRAGAIARLEEIARRLGLSPAGLYLVTECVESDPAYVLLESAYPNRHRHQHSWPAEKWPSDAMVHASPAGASTHIEDAQA